MRAKFIIKIPATGTTTFPTNSEIESRMLLMGLGRNEPTIDFDERATEYAKAADREWAHLPEHAEDERSHVLFWARLPGFSRLLMTRYDQGYVVVRLINNELSRLLRAAEDLVEEFQSKAGALPPYEIDHAVVEIYEKGENHVIMRGRVVSSPVREAIRRDPQTVITAAVTGIASFLCLFILAWVTISSQLWQGTLERFSTAMLATFFVSLATAIRIYAQVKRSGRIVWTADTAEVH